MLFSNALLIAIAGATVSAAVDVKLPEGWSAVSKRQESPRVNKLFARLARRQANASDSTKIPPGSTYTYVDPTTTVTIIGGSSSTAPSTSTITEAPSSSTTSDDGAFQTSTEVIATSCDEFGDCITTTFIYGYNTD